jgi:hypothetical protein
MNHKGFGRKGLWPNRGTIKAFAWRDKENNENRRIADVPAETLRTSRMLLTNVTAVPA